MKKLFLIVAAGIMMYSSAMSQIAVSGAFGVSNSTSSFSMNNTTVDGPKSLDFTLIPRIEYYLSEQLSVGLGIGYSLSSIKTVAGTTTTINSTKGIVISPFARYYFITGDKGAIFGEVSLNSSFGSKFSDVNNTKTKTDKISSIGLGVGPGFELSISDKFAIEGSFGFLGYSLYKEEDVTTTPSTISKSGGISLDLNASTFGLVGIKYYLSK